MAADGKPQICLLIFYVLRFCGQHGESRAAPPYLLPCLKICLKAKPSVCMCLCCGLCRCEHRRKGPLKSVRFKCRGHPSVTETQKQYPLSATRGALLFAVHFRAPTSIQANGIILLSPLSMQKHYRGITLVIEI